MQCLLANADQKEEARRKKQEGRRKECKVRTLEIRTAAVFGESLDGQNKHSGFVVEGLFVIILDFGRYCTYCTYTYYPAATMQQPSTY